MDDVFDKIYQKVTGENFTRNIDKFEWENRFSDEEKQYLFKHNRR